MKIYIDSADIEQIQEAFSWGIVDGITTNPSLIKAAFDKAGDGVTMRDYISRILETAGEAPVSLEVIGPSEAAMTAQGLFLYETFNPVAGNVVIKVPVNPNLEAGGDMRYDGLKTIRAMAARGIPVNTTLIFTPEQAMLAAKAGARYVSPFAGRVDDKLRKDLGLSFEKTDYFPEDGLRDDDERLKIEDVGIHSGVHLVEQIASLFMVHDFECEVLAASLRNPRQVRECALAGADISTVPFKVIRDMVEHPKTVEGMNAFCADVVPEYRSLLPEG
jgi:transaldolase